MNSFQQLLFFLYHYRRFHFIVSDGYFPFVPASFRNLLAKEMVLKRTFTVMQRQYYKLLIELASRSHSRYQHSYILTAGSHRWSCDDSEKQSYYSPNPLPVYACYRKTLVSPWVYMQALGIRNIDGTSAGELWVSQSSTIHALTGLVHK